MRIVFFFVNHQQLYSESPEPKHYEYNAGNPHKQLVMGQKPGTPGAQK